VLFAVHPIQVESVAWMTELKNTLSGVLYLSAALTYLRFDRDRNRRAYVGALALFGLALLSKTVAATLPAGLLVVFWWLRGRLSWRRDVVPLLPFFALGAAGAWMTSWVERTFIGATGAEFNLSLIDRCLVAGRVIPFYLGKLIWPANLIFMYPRWQISEGIWWQYLYPLATVSVVVGLWLLRRWSRSPLAAVLYFCVTLSPALGFVNVYPFKYSFVADHFQYLASIGIIALAAGALVQLIERWQPASLVPAQAVLVLALGVPLALLTRNQSRQYTSAEALYLATLNRNPGSWLAHSNLAMLRLHRSAADFQDAFGHLQTALAINPNEPLVRNNIGTALMEVGRLDDALEQHKEAVRLAPGYAEAYGNLGTDFHKLGRFDEAVEAYRTALRIKPQLGVFHSNLGIALEKLGRPEEAGVEIREALKIDPQNIEDHNALGDALLRVGRADDAIAQYRLALTLDPNSVQTLDNLGYALSQAARFDEAAGYLRDAIRLQPGDAAAHDNLGNVLQATQRLDEAVAEYEKALQTASAVNLPDVHNDLGVALARLGRREESVAHFRDAVRLRPHFPAAQANLARALGQGK
jgi:tetratricopeptide (TPR) repeat protein